MHDAADMDVMVVMMGRVRVLDVVGMVYDVTVVADLLAVYMDIVAVDVVEVVDSTEQVVWVHRDNSWMRRMIVVHDRHVDNLLLLLDVLLL